MKKLEALEQENKHLKENNSQLNDHIKGVCVSKVTEMAFIPPILEGFKDSFPIF